jgi:hypothetical protein
VEDQKRLLEVFGRLATTVPIRKLEFASGFDKLPAVYDAILQDVSANTERRSSNQ